MIENNKLGKRSFLLMMNNIDRSNATKTCPCDLSCIRQIIIIIIIIIYYCPELSPFGLIWLI